MSSKSALLSVMLVVVSGRLVWAQPGSPVYPDDSPAAAAALSAMAGMLASGNADEAVRALQKLLDDSGDRVVESVDDDALFVSVRGAVHQQLLAEPELLVKYRESQGGRAAAALDAGSIDEVERVYLLTAAGYEAALRLTQRRLEAARFNAAYLTLLQLEKHPDRVGERDAAMLAAQIARYLPREEVVELAQRWLVEADQGEIDLTPFERPALADVRVMTPMLGGEALIAEQIPPTPMWTVRLENDGSVAVRNSSTQPPDNRGEGLWTYPTIADDVLLVNDTVWIRAWDRYTLEPLWRVKPGVGGPANPQSLGEAWAQRTASTVGRTQIEDTSSVSVWAHVAIAVTGFAKDSMRLGDGQVHGLDVRTGETLWSVAPGTTNNPFEQGAIRGPVLVDEGLAVVSVRRSARTRRVVSFYLMGIDALTGETRWTRPIGSAGALPFANDRRIANSSVLDRGVVYASDQMGVVAAIEAETGRPIWVRRLGVSEIALGMRTSAWESISAVVHGDVVYMLTPTRDQIVAIDRLTGAVLSSRTADRFGRPHPEYLVGAGEYLVAVSGDQVAVVLFEEFRSGTIRLSERFARNEIRGRVVVGGDRVYVPTGTGVVEIDPANPSRPTRSFVLDHSGTALPSGEQIVVVDDHAVHAYVSWSVADRVLQERMDAEPNHAAPAVSYADLAFRVGRMDRIVPAVDRALEALASRPNDPSNITASARLFVSLHSMATSLLDEKTSNATQKAVLLAVTERLGRVAQTDAQRIEYLLTRGRVLESQAEYAWAADAYREILEQGNLALVERVEEGRHSNAAEAATLALRELVLTRGAEAQGEGDTRAAAALAAIPDDAEAGVYESFAVRYPVAKATAHAWMRAASRHGKAGRSGEQTLSLRHALLVAEIVHSMDSSAPLIEEAAGGLVAALSSSGRSLEAAQILSRLVAEYESFSIAGRSGAVVLEELQQTVEPRGARIGNELTGKTQSIAGWTLMPTLVEEGDRGGSHVLLRSAGGRAFSLWGPVEAAGDLRSRAVNPDGPGALAMLWSRSFADFEPAVVRVSPDAVYLLWATPRGGEIEKVRAVDGETIWRTQAFDTLFQPDGAVASRVANQLRQPIMFSTPNNVRRLMAELIVSADSDSVVLVERSGRIAFFHPETGELVRTQVSDVQTVFDVDVSDGVVALVGSAQMPRADSGRVPIDPAIAVYSARSGDEVETSAEFSSVTTWVRASAGTVMVGMRESIVCVELASGRSRWEVTGAQGDDAAENTMAGWVYGDAAYLLGMRGELTVRSVQDGGLLSSGALMGSGRFGRTDIRAQRVTADRVAFMGGGGLVVVDSKGSVVGMDSIDSTRRAGIMRPVFGEGKIVMIERATTADVLGRGLNRVHVIASDSGELLGSRDVAMMQRPIRVSLLDGRMAISTASMTVVFETTGHDSDGNR